MIVPEVPKYWLKFSSPESTVPHGVCPPAQLFSVPSTRVPVGSAVVRVRGPTAGPRSSNGVVAVMRRLYEPMTGSRPPSPGRLASSTTVRPWAAHAISTCSRVGFAESYPRNMVGSVVYSWLTVSR